MGDPAEDDNQQRGDTSTVVEEDKSTEEDVDMIGTISQLTGMHTTKWHQGDTKWDAGIKKMEKTLGVYINHVSFHVDRWKQSEGSALQRVPGIQSDLSSRDYTNQEQAREDAES